MKIFDVNIANIDYEGLKNKIHESLRKNEQTLITYVTADSLNKIYSDNSLVNIYSEFDIVHPDGIGIYLASKFLFGKNGIKTRITGSDFYPLLEKEICLNNWKVFFFGDTKQTLKELIDKEISKCVVGVESGFNFIDETVIEKINKTLPDILIVGLGSPKQEKWVVEHHSKINAKIILCVGDGIKVFTGTKRRGNKLIRMLGLEWIIRLFNEPKRLWKRYLIGIPIFIFRIIILKIKNKRVL